MTQGTQYPPRHARLRSDGVCFERRFVADVLAERDVRPSGEAVIPILTVIFLVSGFCALVTTDRARTWVTTWRCSPRMAWAGPVYGQMSRDEPDAHCVGINVYNASNCGGPTATAHDVVVGIEVRRAKTEEGSTSPVSSIGRWGHSYHRMPGHPEDWPQVVTFRPTREEQHLPLAIQPPQGECLFLRRNGYFSLQGGSEFRLTLFLRGDGLRKPARFDFKLARSEGRLELTPIERRRWRRLRRDAQ